MSDVLWGSRGPRSEGAKEEKRLILLETAARMFTEDGYERTSLTDIAKQLGITKPSLYYYVKSKEDILFSIIKICLEALKTAGEAHEAEEATGRDHLKAYIRDYARFIGTDIGKCLVTTNVMALSGDSRDILKDGRRVIDRAVRKIVAKGIADGSLATSSPQFSTFAIFGALNWMCFWYQENSGISIDEIVDEFLEFFLKGLEPR